METPSTKIIIRPRETEEDEFSESNDDMFPESNDDMFSEIHSENTQNNATEDALRVLNECSKLNRCLLIVQKKLRFFALF